MDYQTIFRDLKNKIFHPIYLLAGEEAFFIDKISDYIEDNVLTEAEKGFNLTVMYGRDSTAQTIIDNARRYPMFSNHQVLIVKEAQQLKDFDKLEHYVNAPLQSTILVICYKHKKFDKRKKIYKQIDKKGITFSSDKLYENKVPGWITQYLAAKD